jgi:nanoRNase/pAp phosphatase (c-di-AMP/oligoRNAs hydrolase)
MDARTSLGRFKEFRVSNYTLMLALIDYCRDHSIEEILELPDVKERVDLYFYHHSAFKDQLQRCSTAHDNLVVLDLRDEEIIFPGNRFMIYALYPKCNVSMYVLWGLRKQNTVFAVGKSIFNRSLKIDIGKLMLGYGGGGHIGAGTCQIVNDQAKKIQQELIQRLTVKD